MPKQVNIGRWNTPQDPQNPYAQQGFPITCKFTSKDHCSISYDEHTNMFTVNDHNSANGTWIMDDSQGLDKMQFYRVKAVTVPAGTWLNLGGTALGNGHHFLVDHILQRNPNDFSREFSIIQQRYAQHKEWQERVQEKVKKKQVTMNILRGIITLVIAVGLYAVLPQDLKIVGTILGGVIAGTIVTILTIKDKNREAMKTAQDNAKSYFLCPKCGKPLNEYMINALQCLSCKAQ